MLAAREKQYRNALDAQVAETDKAATHTTLMLGECRAVRQKLYAKEQKKAKAKEGRFNLLSGQVGILTAPEAREQYDALKADWLAKEDKRIQIVAAKAAQAAESNMQVQSRAADDTHRFHGTFRSYFTSPKDEVLALALSLCIPILDAKKKEFNKAIILKAVSDHFDNHPELKIHHRYVGLFDASARIKRPRPTPPVAISDARTANNDFKLILDREDDQELRDISKDSDFGDGGSSGDEEEVNLMYGVNGDD